MDRLGDLSFDFTIGTCGTFMIDGITTILLCFSGTDERRRCRSLKRKNDGPLTSITNFEFENEFDTYDIADSTHDHWMASLASYQGFPLILGGTNNNKLEMLDTTKNLFEWIEYEGTEYPYENQYVKLSYPKWNHFKNTFRLYAYSVIATPISVIYFGGFHSDEGPNDMVAEYKNHKWTELGRLASRRYGHRSIKMESKIYIFGGFDTT